MIYKTLHRKLKITQQESHKITGGLGVVKAGAPEVYAVPAPLVKSVVLLL